MKKITKYIILLTILSFFSCSNYHKEKKIYINDDTNTADYIIKVKNWTEIIEIYTIPLKEISEAKIDSINNKADSLIINIKQVKRGKIIRIYEN